MGRYLIVANQTLGGGKLARAIEERISRNAGTLNVFYVIVPMTPIEHESTAWMGGFLLGDEATMTGASVREVVEAEQRRRDAELDESRQRAHRRLQQMLDQVHVAGGEAEGAVGTGDPVRATEAVLAVQADFDEIIVSTLPSTLSHWLRLDVPSRIARLTDTQVTTVEAEE